MSYEIISHEALNGEIHTYIQRSDGAFIPIDENNADYQAYLRWLEEQA